MTPFIVNVQNLANPWRQKVDWLWPRAVGREDWGMMAEKVKVSFWDDGNALKLVVVMH